MITPFCIMVNKIFGFDVFYLTQQHDVPETTNKEEITNVISINRSKTYNI